MAEFGSFITSGKIEYVPRERRGRQIEIVPGTGSATSKHTGEWAKWQDKIREAEYGQMGNEKKEKVWREVMGISKWWPRIVEPVYMEMELMPYLKDFGTAYYTADRENLKKTLIYDCTKREGEQCSGVAMDRKEKIAIARRDAQDGIPFIEGGMPVSEAYEERTVKEMVEMVRREGYNSRIFALGRMKEEDINIIARTGAGFHGFQALSAVHSIVRWKMLPEDVIPEVDRWMRYAAANCNGAKFSVEDAARAKPGFLLQVGRTLQAIDPNIIFNIPETMGNSNPAYMYALARFLSSQLDIPISVHSHNDLEHAVANTVAAVLGGAQVPQFTWLKAGERTGNASLELFLSWMYYHYDISLVRDPKRIIPMAKETAGDMRLPIAANAQIVGKNAFLLTSGVHTDGEEKAGEAGAVDFYMFMNPEEIGGRKTAELGQRGGIANVRILARQFGIELAKEQMTSIRDKAKELNKSQAAISEADFLIFAQEELGIGVPVKLNKIRTVAESDIENGKKNMHGEAWIRFNGETKHFEADSDGTVDAPVQALEKALGHEFKLTAYEVHSAGEGTDALANVAGKVAKGDIEVECFASDKDTITASVVSMFKGIRAILFLDEYRKRNGDGQD